MHLFFIITFILGLLTPLVGRFEIRTLPGHFIYSKSFIGFFFFLLLVMLPVTAYFFLFYGDWFLLYFYSATQIPSALVVFLLMCQVLVGTMGFWIGVFSIRKHREVFFPWVLFLGLFSGFAITIFFSDRFGKLGSYDQYWGQFGLSSISESLLPLNFSIFGGVILAAISAFWGRLFWSRRYTR